TSLLCERWRGDEFVHVQSGMDGMPWFRLAETMRSEEHWLRLRKRAIKVLSLLHATIVDIPEWSRCVHPAGDLRRQANICRNHHVNLSHRANDAIDACAESLDALAEIPWFAQHGDFCLNNLLVSRS